MFSSANAWSSSESSGFDLEDLIVPDVPSPGFDPMDGTPPPALELPPLVDMPMLPLMDVWSDAHIEDSHSNAHLSAKSGEAAMIQSDDSEGEDHSIAETSDDEAARRHMEWTGHGGTDLWTGAAQAAEEGDNQSSDDTVRPSETSRNANLAQAASTGDNQSSDDTVRPGGTSRNANLAEAASTHRKREAEHGENHSKVRVVEQGQLSVVRRDLHAHIGRNHTLKAKLGVRV
jgi:hypothetical protein